jgi:hypothetical protein
MKWIIILLASSILFSAPALLMENKSIGNESEIIMPIDNSPPESTISSPTYLLIPPDRYRDKEPMILLEWEGHDNEGGSGIAYFDVHYRYSDMDSWNPRTYSRPQLSEWIPLIEGTKKCSEWFLVEEDMYYSFRVRAVDNIGNEEEWREIGESRTIVIEMPDKVYQWILEAEERMGHIKDKVQSMVPDDTAPVSKVLQMDPIVVPEPMGIDEEIRIMMYPDDTYWVPPRTGIIWNYPSIEIEWEGFDPKGTEDLTYDVQYRRTYLSSQIYSIPENNFVPPYVPKTTEWKDLLTDTSDTECLFEIQKAGIYEFRCRAKDNMGNVEEYPLIGDTAMVVLPSI